MPPHLLIAAAALCLASVAVSAGEAIDIGSRRELFIDDILIDKLSGARQVLQHPTPRETCLVCDAPWEGSGCGYFAVFRDGESCKMYYRGAHIAIEGGKSARTHDYVACLATSPDGIAWTKPDLGVLEFQGSKHNNIVWVGRPAAHDFTPFRDTHPACKPEARYKAISTAGMRKGALAFQSPDGIHWSAMNDGKPVITKGAFDTQNLAFWDTVRREYRAYVRDFRNGVRDVRTCTSQDFIHWTEPAWLDYPGAPREHIYTNQVLPYYRAPHIFIGFPTRYLDRGWTESTKALPELDHRKLRAAANRRYGTALTEGLLMVSRDGRTFHRWKDAFLRPGPERPGQWKYGDNYLAWHVVETASHLRGAPPELSLYATESYWTGKATALRRYTLRIDGFVAVHAAADGGEMVTKPLTFQGKRLSLNLATSIAGDVRVELQDPDGRAIEGFAAADCHELFGDTLDRVVAWKGGADVSKLAGQPVRLRFVLRDADLYSFQFQD